MRNDSAYPFSDLTPDAVHRLTETAREERAEVMRGLFAALFRRKRETQISPPKDAPALSHTAYC